MLVHGWRGEHRRRDRSGSSERHGEHPGTWSAWGWGARAACGARGVREQGTQGRRRERGRKGEKEKEKKKKKKKRGAGGIRGDGRPRAAVGDTQRNTWDEEKKEKGL